ncbi:hypothetical protein [Nesterenkonia muleiensis]|uniref:hypothetical protein n=1 Tax=Nesterenkonia muleiensis TaxID=2282648 RepID=UPI000E738262|nr:hypothetical protein [Nesterenkonia muleiensis]
MIAVLRNPTYAKLFSAQVIALLGTGLLTGGIALPILPLVATGGIAWMDGTPQWAALLTLWVSRPSAYWGRSSLLIPGKTHPRP